MKCGYTGPAIQIHHKDQDRTNSDPSNLAVYCANCHIEEHHASRASKTVNAPFSKDGKSPGSSPGLGTIPL